MALLILLVAAVAVIGIAFLAVGTVVGRGEATASVAVFDVVDATHAIADELPEAVTGRLTYDELELVVGWYASYLEERGVAFERGDGPDPDGDLFETDVVVDVDPAADAKVVTDEHALAFVLLRVEDSEFDLTDAEVTEIAEKVDGHLRRIGAVGPVAEPEE